MPGASPGAAGGLALELVVLVAFSVASGLIPGL